MSSKAFSQYLDALLKDAEELEKAHGKLRTNKQGRQWGLGALNRGVVVISVSAWEAYIEELVKECLEAMRPPAPPFGVWPSLNAAARSQIGRFNTPNPDNVRTLLSEAIGIADVTDSWFWQGTSPKRARERLAEALRHRHHIAHGVNPRPTIHNQYASRLPEFFRRLGRCTDGAVRGYLVGTLGVRKPWPK